MLEPLESRIAPAILVNPTTVTYTDGDGDAVTVKISKGAFDGVIGGAPSVNNFIFFPLGGGQEQLQRVELANQPEFQGAKLTITSAPVGGGNGFVNVGFINAAGIDITGNVTHSVTISGVGQLATSATSDVAIGSVKVTGVVSFANLLAGYNQTGAALNPDAQIGTVNVGGNWTASNLVAGVASGDAFFGNPGDISIVSTNDTAVISKIASITIGGNVFGTGIGGDFFGFVAEHVVSVKINGAAIPLTAGPRNDTVPVNAGAGTADVFVLEVL